MRAKFVRGEDPKKALGIGKHSQLWGRVEDAALTELNDLNAGWNNPKFISFPQFFISRDKDRMGIYFPHSTESEVHNIFRIFNSHNLFDTFNHILREYEPNAYIGANLSSPEYFEYDIPDEIFIEGKFMEFYIQRLK